MLNQFCNICTLRGLEDTNDYNNGHLKKALLLNL